MKVANFDGWWNSLLGAMGAVGAVVLPSATLLDEIGRLECVQT